MPAAEQLLTSAVISALGWTLVHFLWQGCIIALVYWLICVLAPRYAASLRYWAGLTGMLLCLLAMLLTFSLSYAPEARFGLDSGSAAAVNPFLILSGSLPDGWQLLESGIEPVLPWVVLLWLAGVAVVSVRTAGDWLEVRSLLRDGLESTEAQLLIALESLKTKLGVQLAVRLLESSRVAVPMAAGLLRPVILMPASVLARLPQDQLEMILAHELGHIRRFDYAFNLLQVALETLLFYHPAIAWMSQRVREERENCCDDLVVRLCGRPATYARALANLEVLRSPSLTVAVPATGGNLLSRIRLIIGSHSYGKSSGLVQFVFAAIAGLMVVFGAQQGYSLSSELNCVASSVQLQASDVQWKTWGQSREAWSEGISLYALSKRKQQLAVLKIESLSVHHLVVPDYEIQAIETPDSQSPIALTLQNSDQSSDRDSSSLLITQATSPAEPLVLNPVTQSLTLADQAQVTADSNQQHVSSDQQTAVRESTLNHINAEIKPLKSRPPNYPWKARRQGIEGFVALEFSIDSNGKVANVEVLHSVPKGVFEKAASKALSRWTFAEPTDTGSRFRQVFDFEMQEIEKVSPRKRPCVSTGTRTCGQISPGIYVVWINSATRNVERTVFN